MLPQTVRGRARALSNSSMTPCPFPKVSVDVPGGRAAGTTEIYRPAGC